jgi:hypothetical protein
MKQWHPAAYETRRLDSGWLIHDRFCPYIDAGEIVSLPDFLHERLVRGPVAETTRRWLSGVREIDL